MASDQIANYLQVLRRKSGFSQSDLTLVLGIVTESQLSRHERSVSTPDLHTALAYEALFHKPVAAIFPGLYRKVSAGIEDRLVRLERLLQESSVRGHKAAVIARKLEFMGERRNFEPSHAIETS